MMTGAARPIEIGLIQINNSFSGQNYLPYSVACLQIYVEKRAADPSRYHFRMPLFKRAPIRDQLAHLDGVDVAGFSTYVWNHRLALETARRLKERRPETLIVFGGPQVPDEPEDYLREHPFIDLAVHNEGERTFLALLEQLPSRDFSELKGVSFIAADGTFVRTANGPRIRDLVEAPSPFLDGAFVELMKANPNENWIGLWETNRGCPFQCTYCDWGSSTAAKVTQFEMDRLKQELDWFAEHKIQYIFCCDANFGILKRDVELAEYAAEVKKKTGFPHRLSVQNTKNATERAYLTQKILSDSGLNQGVTLSMQSMDHTALENIKRDNISLDTFLELQRRFTRDGVETYSDLILALPGETYDSFVGGLSTLIETGQHNRIQFNNLTILPNAQMAKDKEKFGMITVFSEIINFHGSKEVLDDDVAEIQEMVVGTAAMPPAEWRKVRALCWMAALLHFDKLFQIPLIVAHEITGVSYRDLFEAFMEVDGSKYPTLGEIRDFFLSEAESIQKGGAEYVYAPDWLGIYWPADEYVFIKLTVEQRFQDFYKDCAGVLHDLTASRGVNPAADAVDEAIKLNGALISQPGDLEDIDIDLNYDLFSFWKAVRNGQSPALERKALTVHIARSTQRYNDFQRWCQEVVWWGNKKGAYLYTNSVREKQLAGHF